MRLLTTIAAVCAALLSAPALAQDPIAQSVEAIANYDTDGALTVLDAACKAGSGEACWRAALVQSNEFSDEAKAAAGKQFLANCAKGDARSCYMMGKAVEYDAPAKDKARARTAIGKACDGGLAFACSEFADMLVDENFGTVDEAAALSARQKACDGNYAKDCHSAGETIYYAADGNAAKLDRALALEKKGCELGNGESCAGLVTIELSRIESPGQADVVRWQGWRKRACELGETYQCQEWLSQTYVVP